jgi:hypothetical protein
MKLLMGRGVIVLMLCLWSITLTAQDTEIPAFEDVFNTSIAMLVDDDYIPPEQDIQPTLVPQYTYEECHETAAQDIADKVYSPKGHYALYACHVEEVFPFYIIRLHDLDTDKVVLMEALEVQPGQRIVVHQWLPNNRLTIVISMFNTWDSRVFYLIDTQTGVIEQIGGQRSYLPQSFTLPPSYEWIRRESFDSDGGELVIMHDNLTDTDAATEVSRFHCVNYFSDECDYGFTVSNSDFVNGPSTIIGVNLGHHTAFERRFQVNDAKTGELIYNTKIYSDTTLHWIAEDTLLIYGFSDDSLNTDLFDLLPLARILMLEDGRLRESISFHWYRAVDDSLAADNHYFLYWEGPEQNTLRIYDVESHDNEAIFIPADREIDLIWHPTEPNQIIAQFYGEDREVIRRWLVQVDMP